MNLVCYIIHEELKTYKIKLRERLSKVITRHMRDNDNDCLIQHWYLLEKCVSLAEFIPMHCLCIINEQTYKYHPSILLQLNTVIANTLIIWYNACMMVSSIPSLYVLPYIYWTPIIYHTCTIVSSLVCLYVLPYIYWTPMIYHTCTIVSSIVCLYVLPYIYITPMTYLTCKMVSTIVCLYVLLYIYRTPMTYRMCTVATLPCL